MQPTSAGVCKSSINVQIISDLSELCNATDYRSKKKISHIHFEKHPSEAFSASQIFFVFTDQHPLRRKRQRLQERRVKATTKKNKKQLHGTAAAKEFRAGVAVLSELVACQVSSLRPIGTPELLTVTVQGNSSAHFRRDRMSLRTVFHSTSVHEEDHPVRTSVSPTKHHSNCLYCLTPV